MDLKANGVYVHFRASFQLSKTLTVQFGWSLGTVEMRKLPSFQKQYKGMKSYLVSSVVKEASGFQRSLNLGFMPVWLLLRKTGGTEMTTTISVTVTCHFCLKVELESYRNCTHEDATNSTPCSLIVLHIWWVDLKFPCSSPPPFSLLYFSKQLPLKLFF